MSNTRLNGEDHYDAAQRMEGTSRMETKMESQMEGLHAEDNPELVATIKAAQEGQERQAEEVQKEWLAAQADGTVARMEGEVDVRKIIPNEVDNEIDALRKLRLAQMKGRAAERQAWLDRGHGKYAIVEQESSFLEELTRHERVVCALTATGSIDGEMLHAHIKQLCRVHVETYFCRLDPERAPVMMGMVSVGQLPALLLCREGKVVDQLHSIDRSFTTEGIAYEIGQRKCIDFEEGTHYAKVGNACTTQTAARARRPPAAGLSDSEEEEDGDISD